MKYIKTVQDSLPLIGTLGALALGISLHSLQAADKPMGPPWSAPSSAAAKKNPAAADKASLRKGKKLYKAACLPCHGSKGAGNGAAAVALPIHPGNLTDSKRMKGQSDGALFWKISEGRGPMPPFKASFSDTDRWNILNYVRTLAK